MTVETREETKPIGIVDVIVNSQERFVSALTSLPEGIHPTYLRAVFKIKPTIELDFIPHGRKLSWNWEIVCDHENTDFHQEFPKFVSHSTGSFPVGDVLDQLRREEFFPEEISYRVDHELPNPQTGKSPAYDAFTKQVPEVFSHYNLEDAYLALVPGMAISFDGRSNRLLVRAVVTELTKSSITSVQRALLNDWLSKLVKI